MAGTDDGRPDIRARREFLLRLSYVYICCRAQIIFVTVFFVRAIFFPQLGFDVFNALDLMDNKEFLEPLKFGIGDGNLQYYLYNWRCPSMTPGKIGLVLQ